MNYLRMELKVCEGCGALWLRNGYSGPDTTHSNTTARLHTDVYCKPCVRTLAQMPAALGPKKASRTRIRVRSRNLTTAPLSAHNGGAR